jgi:hypothetical protein
VLPAGQLSHWLVVEFHVPLAQDEQVPVLET